jgi:flagellar biosynthesis anti-sigma factor FlgM
MKITPLSEAYATSSLHTSKPESKVEAAGCDKTPTQTKSLVVSLSREAQSMSKVDGLVGLMNMAKIETVRAEIQNGTFRVNPELIADRLLEGIRKQLPEQP